MKIKFAAVALLLSATLCCSDSFGHDLLHRLLGRGGCGCDAAPTCCDTPAPACGGRTFSININLPGRGLLAGLRNPGCGSAVSDCGCDAGPVASCGCDAAPMADCGCDTGCGSGGLLSGRYRGARCGGCGLFKGGLGDGCGCDMMASTPCESACDAGCDSGDACGCGGGLLSGGLFKGRLRGRVSGLFNRGCGCGSAVSDCGCDAPAACGGCDAAPVFYAAPAPSCGCDAPDSSCGCDAPGTSCGYGAGPVANCGCDSAPNCGCGGLNFRDRVGGLLSRVGNSGCGTCGSTTGCGCGAHRTPVRNVVSHVPRPLKNRRCGCGAPAGSDCGCDGAIVSDCGCDAGAGSCGCGGGKLSLLDRVRGNRVSDSRRSYGSCNDGCNSPCPNTGVVTNSGCGCSGGAVQSYDAGYSPAPVYNGSYEGNSVITAPDLPAAQPSPAAPAVEGDVVVPGDGAYRSRTPVVDPNAFIIRNTGYRN